MKLCTICDRPITGTWCKTCKKFVKTYDISNDIHLNQSHDLRNDAGCTYHTSSTVNRTAGSNTAGRSYTSTTARPTTNANTRTTQNTTPRTTTNTYTSNRTTGTGSTSSGQSSKKSPKKLVGIIIGAYVLMVIGFTIVPMLAPLIIDTIKESRQEETKKEKEKETEKKDTGTKLGSTGTGSLAQMLLRNVDVVDEMTETEDGEEVTYYFYDPEDVEDLGVDCDWEHFSMKRSYFESWTEQQLDITMEPVLDQSEELNYIYETEDDSYAYFISYAEYIDEDDLAISVDYDTSSGRIHSLILYTTNHDKYADYFSDLATELDTEYDWDSELLQLEMMYAVEDKEDYETEEIYCSDTMILVAFPFENGIGLMINVVVE